MCGRLCVLIPIILIALGHSTQAQSQKQVDSLTYALYMQGSWDELTEAGETAIEQGTDFYFLRLRIAWAHFAQGHYRQSIPHYEKALEMNPESFPAREYLYYSLLYSGLTQRARHFAARQSGALQKKIGFDADQNLLSTHLFGGYSLTPHYDYLESMASPGAELQSSSQKNFFYTTAGGNWYTKDSRWAFAPQLSYYRFNNLQSYVHPSFGNNISSDKFDTYTNQMQAYLAVDRYRDKNWHITLAGHYVYDSYTFYSPPPLPTSDFTESTESMSSYVAHGGLAYDFCNYTAEIYLQTSNMNGAGQNQFGLGLLWLPMGNYKLWMKASLNYLLEDKTMMDDSSGTEKTESKTYLVGLFNVGSRLGNLALELKTGYGDSPFTNFTYNSASVVLNSIDRTRYFAGLDATYWYSGQLGLSVGYTLYDQVSIYYVDNLNGSALQGETYPYTSHLVNFGLVYQL